MKNHSSHEKNKSAQELAALRMVKMTAEQRRAVAKMGGLARKDRLTPEQRSEIARKAGKAGGRGRKKKSSPVPGGRG